MQVEQEEEFITNKLMKRLKQLKDEKQNLANEVEQEEEYLVNTLQKRLVKLNGEKVDLENQLEIEQEYVVNKLQKKVKADCRLSSAVHVNLIRTTSKIVPKLPQHYFACKTALSAESSPSFLLGQQTPDRC